MAHYFGCGVAMLIVLAYQHTCVTAQTTATNCQPYTTAELRPSTCTASDKNLSVYKDLLQQMQDASRNEHLSAFVIDTVLYMYKFLNPCLTMAEAVLDLFYENSPSPDDAWLQATNQQLGQAPLIGRRRATPHYSNENALLQAQLAELTQRGHAGCIQQLLDTFKAYADQQFKAANPNFQPPTTTTTTTTPEPTTTTPEPTTTTPEPTTVTTPEPTTTPKPTTTPEPTTTESTTPVTTRAPVTYGPITCTECSGIMCLIGAKRTACPDSQYFCLTTVKDSTSGRDIIRGCATQATCDDLYLTQTMSNTDCVDVDHHIVHDHDNSCYFCCLGDNCNHPPQVTPDPTSLYTRA